RRHLSTLFPYTTLFRSLTAYITERNVLLSGRRVGGASNPAYFTLWRDDFRTRLWESLTAQEQPCQFAIDVAACLDPGDDFLPNIDRKSTRLNSSHRTIS